VGGVAREAMIRARWPAEHYDNSMAWGQPIRTVLTSAWRAARKAAEGRWVIICCGEHTDVIAAA